MHSLTIGQVVGRQGQTSAWLVLVKLLYLDCVVEVTSLILNTLLLRYVAKRPPTAIVTHGDYTQVLRC